VAQEIGLVAGLLVALHLELIAELD
jgi:hypothetical protein